MLVTLSEVLKYTRTQNYSIPAFNVFGFEDAKAVVDAAEELNSPVILATNKDAINHTPINILGKMLVELANHSDTKVVIHLDHGKDYKTVAQAIRYGYSSVMYDGSQLSLEENIEKTKEIVKLAHSFNIPVEAEIGSVGYNDLKVNAKRELTRPEDAQVFVEQTQVDALAVSVGSLHRMEEQSANIDFELINDIQSCISIPLVMHGSTGIPDEDLIKITKTSFGKVNIGTALRMSFGETLRQEFKKKLQEYDRIKLFQQPMESVKQVAIEKMKLLNSIDKAKMK